MKLVTTIARLLLGLMFFVFGLNMFLNFMPMQPMPGLAGQYMTVMFMSHVFLFIGAIDIVAGLLLLTKQFVPLGLVLLAPILVNILIFHITMQPKGIGPGLVAVLLWCLAAWRVRAYFLPLLVPKAAEKN